MVEIKILKEIVNKAIFLNIKYLQVIILNNEIIQEISLMIISKVHKVLEIDENKEI